jgi:hypothetical protein
MHGLPGGFVESNGDETKSVAGMMFADDPYGVGEFRRGQGIEWMQVQIRPHFSGCCHSAASGEISFTATWP